LDADGLTFACAMTVEARIARRLGRTALVGLGASRGVPEGRLVSFGIAGALAPDLPVGTVIDATRVVDESGAVLWEGAPLGAASARTGTILGASRIVDDPAEPALIRVQERESGFFADLECLLERLIPLHAGERERLVALLLGPRTEQIPFTEGRLHLGTYQRIFLVAFEDRCADEWMVTIVGAGSERNSSI